MSLLTYQTNHEGHRMTASTAIQSARLAKGLTYRSLAALIGSSHNAPYTWEHDISHPRPVFQRRLEVVLGLTPGSLTKKADTTNA